MESIIHYFYFIRMPKLNTLSSNLCQELAKKDLEQLSKHKDLNCSDEEFY